MLQKKIKEEKEFSLSLNEADKLLYFIWKPVMFSQERFKEIVIQFAATASEHKVEFLFIDARDHKVSIVPETQKWHDEVISPQYVAAGIKKIAFLVPNNIFSELTHVKVFSQKNTNNIFETEFFKSAAAAEKWLKN